MSKRNTERKVNGVLFPVINVLLSGILYNLEFIKFSNGSGVKTRLLEISNLLISDNLGAITMYNDSVSKCPIDLNELSQIEPNQIKDKIQDVIDWFDNCKVYFDAQEEASIYKVEGRDNELYKYYRYFNRESEKEEWLLTIFVNGVVIENYKADSMETLDNILKERNN